MNGMYKAILGFSMSLGIEVNILFLIIHKKKLRMRTVLIFLAHYLETREQLTTDMCFVWVH